MSYQFLSYFAPMKSALFLVVFILNFQFAFSQKNKSALSAFDVSIATNADFASAEALSWYRIHPVALKKKFSLGYGLRFTAMQNNHQKFITAPAKVSEGNFFKKQNEAKLDSFFVPSSVIFSFNTMIYLHYQFNTKWSLSFNIDAFGLSFGKKVKGTFESYSLGQMPSQQSAKVTPFNALLTGDYDWGSLNSEFSVNYKFKNNWVLRPGITFLFAEYTTDNNLAFNNNRFRKKTLLPMIGLSYFY